MERRRLTPIRLLSCDLDGTLCGDGTATRRFRQFWRALEEGRRPLLVYNSGRFVDDIRAFAGETGLPEPDYIIGGVGTMLATPHLALDRDFLTWLGPAIDREAVTAALDGLPDLAEQPACYQHAHKASWHLHNASEETIRTIEESLAARDVQAKLVYSSGRDLDILPAVAGKGKALGWLGERLGIGLEEVVVAGDTGNDLDMFELAGVRGIAVGNALAELRGYVAAHPHHFQAGDHFADGVIEGLRHWGL